MKKFSYIVAVMVALLVTSCKDSAFFKTESPSASDVVVFTNPNQVEQIIAGIYEQMMEENSYRNRLSGPWVSLSTDIEGYRGDAAAPPYATHSMTVGGHGDLIKKGAHPWIYLTTAIERANICIDGIEQNSDTTLAVFRYLYGEALSLRAWLHYEMTKLWGDVPYSFAPIDVSDPDAIYPYKVDRNQIYEKIRVDLKHAAELMGNSKDIKWPRANNNVERMNREFALGLLARVDLVYAGKALRPDVWVQGGGAPCSVQFNAKDPAKRVELLNEVMWACEQVMDADGGVSIGGSSKLQDSFEKVFKNICAGVITYDKTESLFEIPFPDNVRGQLLNRCGESIASDALNHLAGTTSASGRNGKIIVVPNFVFKFEKGDKRKWITVSPFQWTFKSDKTADIAPWRGASTNILYQKCDNIYQFTLAKYRYEWLGYEMKGAEDGVNLPIMRYSDILLMFAEASIGSVSEVMPTYMSKYSGQQCFDAVRARAGLASKTLDMKAIQDERAFEFCGEHVRKYDLMRWGIFASTLLKAQSDLSAFYKATDGKIDFSGTEYAGKLSTDVYFRYKADPALSKGDSAYVVSEIYGLTLGENDKPADYVSSTDNAGWVKSDPYVSDGVPRMKETTLRIYAPEVESNLEMHQYWPLFTEILSSNHNLWNDYGY